MHHTHAEVGIPLDFLELRTAVLGGGLVLQRPADGALVLYSVAAGRARRLGRFIDAAGAWQALDAQDGVPDRFREWRRCLL